MIKLGKKLVFAVIFSLLFSVSTVVFGQQSDVVKLGWDANTESDLAGYKIYTGTVSGTYTNIIDVHNVTEFTIPNLTVDTTYFFAATAYDSSGNESGYSNEISYLVVDTIPPSAIITLKIIIIIQ